MAITLCPTCRVQIAGGTRKSKRKRTRPSRGRSSSSSRDSRASSQRRTRGIRAPSTPPQVGYLRRRAMALAKTLERNPSAKARQSFVTRMRNKFPYATILKKDSPTIAIKKALDAQEAANEEHPHARKPTNRARNGRRSSSTRRRSVAAVKKQLSRQMARQSANVLLVILSILASVGVLSALVTIEKADTAVKTAKDEAKTAKQEAVRAQDSATQAAINAQTVMYNGYLSYKVRSYSNVFVRDIWVKDTFCELYSNGKLVIHRTGETKKEEKKKDEIQLSPRSKIITTRSREGLRFNVDGHAFKTQNAQEQQQWVANLIYVKTELQKEQRRQTN